MTGPIGVKTAFVRGIEAVPVTVEIAVSAGIPGMSIVGMPDSAVLEARSRVRCALRDCGFQMPRMHITINLSPGELRKSGTSFDLAIAVAILMATGQMPERDLTNYLFVGELGLSGMVCPTRGLKAFLAMAKERGLTPVVSSELETRFLPSRHVLLDSLSDLRIPLDAIRGEPRYEVRDASFQMPTLDYADVMDQEAAKRALVIAAAGKHGLLMVGPPGSGKSMLAGRFPGILPPLSEREAEQVALIHSVVGDSAALDSDARPFRSPHHSISLAGLLGGGRPILPGEISLAHRGVLFLDELPEFSSNVLQSLRQPLEDKVVRLVRVDGTYVFPCDFTLLAAANPCPCGYLGDKARQCTCIPSAIARYRGKVGGPLMDRIDLQVEVARPRSSSVLEGQRGLSTDGMRRQVMAARAFARDRLEMRGDKDVTKPADLDFDGRALRTLEAYSEANSLGGRAITRTARVARTIADLEQHPLVGKDDVLEACAYRERFGG